MLHWEQSVQVAETWRPRGCNSRSSGCPLHPRLWACTPGIYVHENRVGGYQRVISLSWSTRRYETKRDETRRDETGRNPTRQAASLWFHLESMVWINLRWLGRRSGVVETRGTAINMRQRGWFTIEILLQRGREFQRKKSDGILISIARGSADDVVIGPRRDTINFILRQST